MVSGPRVPTSTYRLQFNGHFGFKDATEIIPYLQKLGISDIYSSPFFRSRPDSDHGYDVSNHNELNLVDRDARRLRCHGRRPEGARDGADRRFRS